MIDKKAWKYAFYYGTRFQIWVLILSIAIGIVENFLDPIINQSVFFGFILDVAIGIYITKFALGKVFFKKYEHFELSQNSDISPKFGKINWKPAIKLYIISFVSAVFLFALILGICNLFYSDFNINNLSTFFSRQALSDSEIDKVLNFISNHWPVIPTLIISIYLLQIAILKWFISKNATITEKQALDKPSNIAKKNNWKYAFSYGSRYILIFWAITLAPEVLNKVINVVSGINVLEYFKTHLDIKLIFYTILGILAIRISVYAMQNYNYKRFTLKPKFNPWLLTFTLYILKAVAMFILLIFKNHSFGKVLLLIGPAIATFFFLKVFVNKFFKIEDKNTTYTIYTEQDNGEQKK